MAGAWGGYQGAWDECMGAWVEYAGAWVEYTGAWPYMPGRYWDGQSIAVRARILICSEWSLR